MRMAKAMLVVGLSLLVLAVLIVRSRGQNRYPAPEKLAAATPYDNTFFDPDPRHPWNQLYGLLFIRPAWNGDVRGLDEMDPLLWSSTYYLLEDPLHKKAVVYLDKFIDSGSVHLIHDPLKRALLQRMLWVAFDHWSLRYPEWRGKKWDDRTFDSERREMQMKLAKIMRAVALTDDEIAALADNYQREIAAKTYPNQFDPAQVKQAFLPANFFSQTDWVDLGTARYEIVAPVHVRGVDGRSDFHVLISLPGGRDATIDYLKKLHDFQPHWTYDQNKRSSFIDMGSDLPWTNKDLPQVPLLTKFALVRKACLIDTAGHIVRSPLMESVQIRVIRTILPNNSSGGEQTFCMFELDQSKLMAGGSGLVEIKPGDLGYDMVLAGGGDPLEQRLPRDVSGIGVFDRVSNCAACHSAPGIGSMNSYRQFFQDRRTLVPPELQEGSSSSISWKQGQYNWGLLQAYWFLPDH